MEKLLTTPERLWILGVVNAKLLKLIDYQLDTTVLQPRPASIFLCTTIGKEIVDTYPDKVKHVYYGEYSSMTKLVFPEFNKYRPKEIFQKMNHLEDDGVWFEMGLKGNRQRLEVIEGLMKELLKQDYDENHNTGEHDMIEQLAKTKHPHDYAQGPQKDA